VPVAEGNILKQLQDSRTSIEKEYKQPSMHQHRYQKKILIAQVFVMCPLLALPLPRAFLLAK
jgi:hypothetical protein